MQFKGRNQKLSIKESILKWMHIFPYEKDFCNTHATYLPFVISIGAYTIQCIKEVAVIALCYYSSFVICKLGHIAYL